MRAIDIIDAVAMRAVFTIHDALAADYNEADRTLSAPIPTHLQASLATASTALVEQVYLDLWDDFTAGRIGDGFDVDGHHNAVMANFNNRMLTSLQLMSAVPPEWLPGCQQAIANTYADRVRELATAGRGGWA